MHCRRTSGVGRGALHDEHEREHADDEGADREERVGKGKGRRLPYQFPVQQAVGGARGKAL